MVDGMAGGEELARELEIVLTVPGERGVSRRAHADAAPRASEAQYRQLFASIDEGFLIAEVLFDGEGRSVDLLYLEANPAATRMTKTDYVGRRLLEIDPGCEPHWLDIWGRVVRSGVGERHERYAGPLDAWFDFHLFRIGDSSEGRVAVLFRDITGRKRRQAHADFLASIQDDLSADASPDEIMQSVGARLGAYLHLGACTFEDVHDDAAEPYVFIPHSWNAAGRSSLLGGKFPMAELFDEELAAAARAGETIAVRDTRTSRHAGSYTRLGVGAYVAVPFHRQGEWRFLLAVAASEARDWRPDEIALIEEVTHRLFPRVERARAEAALRASEARLRLALDVTELGTWTFSLTDDSGHLDDRAAQIVGLPAGDFADVAQAQAAGTHPDDLAPMQAAAAKGIAGGEPFELAYRVVHPDGTVHHVTSHARVVTDGTGRPIALLGTNRDVTAEHEAITERERLLGAAEAARAEAEAARDAAEAANRAKGDFLAVMSHELRTPLNAIGGYAELMKLGIRGPVTEQQREDLSRIQQSQRHLLGLINQVLNYARVDAGAVRYDLVDAPVGEALAAAEALILPQVRAKGIRYVLGACPPELVVRADREKLQQILLNLLTNAVKFTEPEGEVRIACARQESGGEGAVAIAVSDTGVGIAPEKLSSVFEPFVQVDQRLNRPHEGVGLGLAISRELARGMGGDLALESEPGRGSTFTLTLPTA